MTNVKFAQAIFWHIIVSICAYVGFIKGIQIFEISFWVFFWIWVSIQSLAIVVITIYLIILSVWKDKIDAKYKKDPAEFDEAKNKIKTAFEFKGIFLLLCFLGQIILNGFMMNSVGKDPSLFYNISIPLFIIGSILTFTFRNSVLNLLKNK